MTQKIRTHLFWISGEGLKGKKKLVEGYLMGEEEPRRCHSAASDSLRGQLSLNKVTPQSVMLNNLDKSLNFTYSRYSPLQGLRAP